MADHARLSPSSAYRWMVCPGSVAAIQAMPAGDTGGNADSNRGTACHAVLEGCLNSGLSPTDYISRVYPFPEGAYTITAEDARNVKIAVDYVRTRQREYTSPEKPAFMLVEAEVHPGSNFHDIDPDTLRPVPTPRDDCKGTADVILAGNGVLEVIDYKNGQRMVTPEQNEQCLLYMLGALKHIEPGAVQVVRLTIVQPRCPTPDAMDGIRTWEFPVMPAAIEWAMKFHEGAAATDDPNAPRRAGEKQCRWCPAKPGCPEAAGKAVTALTAGAEAFEEVRDPAPDVDGLDSSLVEVLTRPPGALTPEQRATVLDAAPFIRSWLTAIQDHGLSLALQGVPTPGYKVVSGRRSRAWAESEEAVMRALSGSSREGGGKLKKAEYTEVKLVSPAQAEKRLKPLVTPRVWAKVEKLIAVRDGKPTLVPETDDRPALAGGADAFDEVPDQTAEEETPTLDFLN